tara:strand:+ start:441 stop:545 length:105 start_codon:yes stop_codon:yes gene_type:complete
MIFFITELYQNKRKNNILNKKGPPIKMGRPQSED